MKSFILTLIFVIAAMGMHAQDCKGFYYFTDNSETVMTVYDKKSKESGKLTYKVSNVTKTGNTTSANFTSEMVDEKGKILTKGAGKFKCVAGIVMVDAKISMPQENMAAYKDMDVKAEETFIEYPTNLSAGQSLKDVNFMMDVYNKGSAFSTVNFSETNRKVVGKETVTSPAGTWECWKITYDAQFKATMAAVKIGIPFNLRATEWFAPGFGIVKTESFSKNGKLLGSTLITSVKK